MANAPHKGANMNPGEYEVDGVRYKWTCVGQWEHFQHFVPQGWLACSHFPDIEKAEKARQELIEAESEGWVEIDDNARIQRDGSDPQVRHEGGICWRALTNPIDKRWPKAYRKGREVAEAEQADLRDAVRELVDNVRDLLIVIRGPWPPSARALECVEAAAKKVEAKL